MAELDDIGASVEQVLTGQPEGDLGNPPDGPESAPKLSGDWTDDDAEAYEENFYRNPDEDNFDAAVTAPEYPSLSDGKLGPVTTRIMPITWTVDNTATPDPGPVMMFPADPNREELVFRAANATTPATDEPFQWASDINLVRIAAQARTGDGDIRLRKHTGPLYVYAPDASGAIKYSGWSVTK